jgi:hypothetical protein
VLTKPKGPREKTPEVYEAENMEEMGKIRQRSPEAIIILHNVLLKGIRAQVVKDKDMLEAYEKMFSGETYPVDKNNPEAYLFVRSLSEEEKTFYKDSLTKGERWVNGGLIIGFTEEDIVKLDEHEDMHLDENGEVSGTYMRQSVPKLTIGNMDFKPTEIEYYGGNKKISDIHKYRAENPEELKRFNALGPGKEKRSHLFWPLNVRNRGKKKEGKIKNES